MFGRIVRVNRQSNCPLDRVLTYKNLIYLLNLQFSIFTKIYMKDNRVNSLARIGFGCDSFVAI